MNKQTDSIRRILVISCQLLALVTGIHLIGSGDKQRLLLAFATPLLVLIPEITERLFRCRMHTALYIAATLYAIGPMLGHCRNFYYILPGWDKLLHGCGGIMFYILGLVLIRLMSGEISRLCSFVFALCFSIAVSAVWEFVEYGADCLLGMDMQADTFIESINSYLLSEKTGVAESLPSIGTVVIDGKVLPSYLDIGLHDTMQDMLLESGCALLAGIIHIFDRGRHPLICPNN